MPMDPLDLAAIGADLARLTDLLRDTSMLLPGSTADAFRAERDEIMSTFDGYLEPRIGAPDAPIVAAIVGASGVGKSTLLNSIAQSHVSEAGVVRPTTIDPVVWADASHRAGHWNDFIERAAQHLGDESHLVLGESSLTAHLTLVDTPPLSLDSSGIAAHAVAIADLCIFVTTPSRYADGLAWNFLKSTRRRGIPILFVMNRLPADIEAQQALLDDLATRLYHRELLAAADSSLLFGIAEGDIDLAIGGLDADGVAAIRKELAEVADPVYRHGLVDETVYATARMVAERARSLTRPMAAELPVVKKLLDAVASAYEKQASLLDRHLESGELAVTSSYITWDSAQGDIAGMITRRAGTAAHAAASEWAKHDESIELVSGAGVALWRHGADTTQAAALALQGWHAGLETLVTSHAKPRRMRWRSIRTRTVQEAWRAVLDGRDEMPRLLHRRFRDGGSNLIATARAELSEAMRKALAADAERFTRYLGSDGLEDIYAAIVDRADILDERLDDLAGQIPGSWSEPIDEVEIVESAPDEVVTIEIAEGSTVIELGGEELYRKLEAVADAGSSEPDS